VERTDEEERPPTFAEVTATTCEVNVAGV